MTEFDPLLSAKILERVAERHIMRASKLSAQAFALMWEGGVPSWHRLVHELESESDACWDRYYSLKTHVRWLYEEADRRLFADLGMSR